MVKYLSLFISIELFFVSFCPLLAQYNTIQDARQISERCFLLTENEPYQAGSVWYNKKVDLAHPFDVYLDINLGCDNAGADGIAFVLQPISDSIGIAGGGIGYQGLFPSFAVELDTYRNIENYNDPFYDHIAIQKNGDLDHEGVNLLAGPVVIFEDSYNAEDCEYHKLRLSWNPNTQLFSVYIDCELRLTYTGDIINEIFGGDSEVYWGITSATGALTNEHYICHDYISFTDSIQDQHICKGETLTIDAGLGASYLWKPAISISDHTVRNPIFKPDTTTTYRLEVIDECGWIRRTDEFTIFVHDQDDFNVSSDTTICSGDSVILDAGPGISYKWTPFRGLNDAGIRNPRVSPDQSTTYTVEVTDYCGIRQEEVTVTVNEAVNVDLGPDTTLCKGTFMEINPILENASSYSWNVGLRDLNIQVSGAGTYILRAVNEVCPPQSDSIVVKVQLPPKVVFPEDTLVCYNHSFELDAWHPGADMYIWSTGEKSSAINISRPGSYSVTLSNNSCPTSSDTIVVNWGNPNALPLPNHEICEGESVQLDAGLGESYNWTPARGLSDSTIRDPVARPDTTTTYIVKTNDICGVRSAGLTVFVQKRVELELGEDTTLCEGERLNIRPRYSNANSFTWKHGDDVANIDVHKSGIYVLEASNRLCPSQSDTLNVYFEPQIQLNFPETQTLCQGDTLVLDATHSSGDSYLWNTGSKATSILAADPGYYEVTVVNQYCPSVVAGTWLDIKQRPEIELPDEVILCEGEEFELNASHPLAAGYLWNTGETSSRVKPAISGTYKVELIHPICLEVVDSTRVIFSYPSAEFNISPDPRAEDVVMSEPISFLSVSEEAEAYHWFFPELDKVYYDKELSVILPTGGTFGVELTVTDVYGKCTDSVYKEIQINHVRINAPNAFSPNGDGHNDRFTISGYGIKSGKLIIGDRWGNVIYERMGELCEWDGRDHSQIPQPEGVYMYTFEGQYRSGMPFRKAGSITLLR